MQLSEKEKAFSEFFRSFLKSRVNFKYFGGKDDPQRFCISKLRTLKMCSDECLKSRFSENPSTSNMTNVPKDCWNLRPSTFIKLIDKFQVNWVGKGLPYWDAKLVLLVTTLAVNEKYPVVNRENLTISIQMQLSKEDEIFLYFLLHFGKKD